jgi:hypothetical protein
MCRSESNNRKKITRVAVGLSFSTLSTNFGRLAACRLSDATSAKADIGAVSGQRIAKNADHSQPNRQLRASRTLLQPRERWVAKMETDGAMHNGWELIGGRAFISYAMVIVG